MLDGEKRGLQTLIGLLAENKSKLREDNEKLKSELREQRDLARAPTGNPTSLHTDLAMLEKRMSSLERENEWKDWKIDDQEREINCYRGFFDRARKMCGEAASHFREKHEKADTSARTAVGSLHHNSNHISVLGRTSHEPKAASTPINPPKVPCSLPEKFVRRPSPNASLATECVNQLQASDE